MANISGGLPEKHRLEANEDQPIAKRTRKATRQIAREALSPAAVVPDSLASISKLLFQVKCKRPTTGKEKEENWALIAKAFERMAKLATAPQLDKEEYLEMYQELDKLVSINRLAEIEPSTHKAIAIIKKTLNIQSDELEETKPVRKKSQKSVSFSQESPQWREPLSLPNLSFKKVSDVLLERVKNREPLYQIHDLLVGIQSFVLMQEKLSENMRNEIQEFIKSLPTHVKSTEKTLSWPPAPHTEKGTASLLTKIYQQYSELQKKLA